ncbi:MAG: hypothetical protein ABI286_04265 [Edaphobacter sp.]
MKTLMWMSMAALLLSFLMFFFVYLTRRKYLAYTGNALFILALTLTGFSAYLHHIYLFAAFFFIFALVWLYKLLTGKVVIQSLI